MSPVTFELPNADAMEALGGDLARACNGACEIHLRGNLGAGKTTVVRGFLRALGHAGAVRSPTYTLIEPYELDGRPVFHLDLYRLADAEELEYLGLRDLQQPGAILLVEWPEQGGTLLPMPDLDVGIDYAADGRRVALSARSVVGEALLANLAPSKP